MDYPFLLRKTAQLPPELVAQCLDALDQDQVIRHPHFTSEERNKDAYRVADERVAEVVGLVADYLHTRVIDKGRLYWNEINLLAPRGLLGEHSDVAYAGYNRKAGNPMEVVLTHKIHVHLFGQSSLRFRRSRHEQKTEFQPEVGGVYWYNNYVWHESFNPSTELNRMALSLIYHDPKWEVRARLLDSYGLHFNDAYQL